MGLNRHIDLQFICHQKLQDEQEENLIHSLQCLPDSRLLEMLYFHIANRCSGMNILDDIMRRYKNAYFYSLSITPPGQKASIPQLYCLPKSIISTCIRDIVQDHCGKMTAMFVQNYLVYLQDWYGQALRSAGLNANICDSDSSSDFAPSSPPIPSGYKKLGISRLLKNTSPGTALDTVTGRFLQTYLGDLSEEELCTTYNVYEAYYACVMSSDDKAEKSKFNILQFAHQINPVITHGTLCSRLHAFTACWHLLQQICGPNVRGLELYATLLVEGCKIQSELDKLGCHWQDMLLGYYINASRVTVFPVTPNCLVNTMSLKDSYYASFNSVLDDLDTVISLLQPGVQEISRKCGICIKSFLNKVRHLQRYALQYTIALTPLIGPG